MGASPGRAMFLCEEARLFTASKRGTRGDTRFCLIDSVVKEFNLGGATVWNERGCSLASLEGKLSAIVGELGGGGAIAANDGITTAYRVTSKALLIIRMMVALILAKCGVVFTLWNKINQHFG